MIKTIVAVSGGKDSTAMALRLREVEPDSNVSYICTPVGNELPEVFEYHDKLETMLGQKLTKLMPYGPIDGLEYLIHEMKMIPNHRARWCTRMLKIVPTIMFLEQHAPCVQCVGLRADEETRGGIYGDMEGVSQRYPLREWGWGLSDVVSYLEDRGICVPERTDCAWCYGQRLIEWKRLWQRHPALYQQAIEIEQQYGHTFRSPQRDTWPAPLDELWR